MTQPGPGRSDVRRAVLGRAVRPVAHVALALIALACMGRGILERFELWIYDLRMEAGAGLASRPWARSLVFSLPRCEQVVVVALDDRTEAAVPERLPLSRRRFARAIDAATRAGASVIALDYFLPGRSFYDPEQDTELAEAIRQSGRVLLARKVVLDESTGSYRATDSSSTLFVEGALDQSFVLAESDMDGVARSLNVLHVAPERFAASLALSAVVRHLGLKSREIRTEPRDGPPVELVLEHAPLAGSPLESGVIRVPLVRGRRALLGFAATGREPPFRTISFIDFESAVAADPELVRGKIVLMGTTSMTSHDRFVVPVSWLPAGSGLPGVYLHALAMRELLWGTAISRTGLGPRLAISLLLALIALRLFVRPGSGRALLALAGGWCALLAAGSVALIRFNVWMDVAGPAALWGALYVLDLALEHRVESTVRRRFEILLSTYHMAALPDADAAPVHAWNPADLMEIREFLAPPGYTLEKVIGRGGMSIVFLGRHARLTRPVAVKYLAPQLFADPDARRRFLQEARVTAELSHPRIVSVYDTGEANGVPFIVLEFVPGESLKQLLRRRGRLGLREALLAARDALEGLAAAHARGIVHRDIKSENLLVAEDGRVKLTDFGIAKGGASGLLQTLPEVILGTPATMSPEQARGEAATPRSDLYSMGIVLFELVTGELPFVGDSPTAILMKQIAEPPPPLDRTRPDAPEALAWLLKRVLAKVPSARVGSAGELMAEIDEVLSGLEEGPSGEAGAGAVAPRPDVSFKTSVVRKRLEDAPEDRPSEEGQVSSATRVTRK